MAVRGNDFSTVASSARCNPLGFGMSKVAETEVAWSIADYGAVNWARPCACWNWKRYACASGQEGGAGWQNTSSCTRGVWRPAVWAVWLWCLDMVAEIARSSDGLWCCESGRCEAQ